MADRHCVIFNCNVRGLNNVARRKVVKDMVGEYKATIVTLQETKLNLVDNAMISETLGAKFTANFVALPADGTKGGIILAVDEDYYVIANTELGAHSVTTHFQLLIRFLGQLQLFMVRNKTVKRSSSWGNCDGCIRQQLTNGSCWATLT